MPPTKSKYFVEHPVDTIRTSIHGTERMLELGKRTADFRYGISIEHGTVWYTL